MSSKYLVGKKVVCPGQDEGVIIENFKLPGDICIKWNSMEWPVSYDEDFLDEHCVIVLDRIEADGAKGDG